MKIMSKTSAFFSIFSVCVLASVPSSSAQEVEAYFKMSIEELMNVEVVSATKTHRKISEAPSTIISITGREMEEMGARTLSDVLKMMTGIQILNRRNGRDMVWIRGVTTGYNTRVLLLIDGSPQREAILGEWSSDEEIQINNIERIEIIRGPGSALYGGNAYAGVISVFTKNEADATKASYRVGSFNTRRLEFYSGKSMGDSKVIVSGNAHETDGHRMARDRKGKETNHRDHVDAKSIQAKFIYKDIRLSVTQNDFVTDYPLYATGRDKPQFYETKNASVDYTMDKDKLSINPKFYYYHTTRFFDNKTRDETGKLVVAHESHLESTTKGFDGQLTVDLFENNTFVTGLSLEQKEAEKYFEEVILQSSEVDSVEYVLGNGELIKVPVALYNLEDRYYFSWLDKDVAMDSKPGPIKTWNYAAYLQNEMRFMENKLSLTLGLRLDKYEGFDAEFSPRVGLVVHPLEGFTIKGLWGRAFKPPTYRQTYMVRMDGKSPGNPDVGPERIRTFEAGLGYNFANNVLASVNYFNNTLTDFIESINYAAYSNSDDKRKISGVEMDLRADYRFRSEYLKSASVFYNYSFVHAIDEIGSQTVDVPSVAKHAANLGVKLRNNWMTVYSGWNFIGKRNQSASYLTGVVGDEYGEKDNKGRYLIWDVNAGFRAFFRLPVKLDVAIHNLLDVEHYNPTYDPDSYYDYTKERRNIALKVTAEL
ncbi:MAG: TonB-dependent receptor [Candidatus Latescibacteria bacterium]|nr:TonB-dependent receptor [Candidatus Latescibacterota bacterium]